MESLEIIETIIKWHKTIRKDLRHLDQVANDAEALVVVNKAKELFMPGRLQQLEGLKGLKTSLEITAEGLDRHFGFEEEWLPDLVEKYGNEETATNWQSILLEHKDLRSRFAHTKNHAAELIEGDLARHLWEASAHDMRAYITNTHKLMQAHLLIEQDLLDKLKEQVQNKREASSQEE